MRRQGGQPGGGRWKGGAGERGREVDGEGVGGKGGVEEERKEGHPPLPLLSYRSSSPSPSTLSPPSPPSSGGSDDSSEDSNNPSADLSSLPYPPPPSLPRPPPSPSPQRRLPLPPSPSLPPSPFQYSASSPNEGTPAPLSLSIASLPPFPPPPPTPPTPPSFSGLPSYGDGGGVVLFPPSGFPSSSPASSSPDSPSFPSSSLLSSSLPVSGDSASPSRSTTPTSSSSQSGSVVGSVGADDPDVFTARSWHSLSAATLLRATEAVDVCCHAIVATNATFHHSSSVTLESRRLALTVAVFERSLYAYALRISTSRQQQRERGGAGGGQGGGGGGGGGGRGGGGGEVDVLTGGSTVSSTSSTPTLAPLPVPAPALALPSLYPHAPFVPQQGLNFTELSALPSHSEWPPLPLSYASTIPSSTAHSLAASAMASSSRLQQHTQQQHTRFLQQHQHQHQHHHHHHHPTINSTASTSAVPAQPQSYQQGMRPSRVTPQLSSSSPSSSATSTSIFSPVAVPSSTFPSLSISPVVSASFYSPASPIPPTVSMPPSQWGSQFRGSSAAHFYSPSGASPVDPSSIPSISASTPVAHPRARTFSASAFPLPPPASSLSHSTSSYPPSSAPNSSHPIATPPLPPRTLVSSPQMRSASPVDFPASTPHGTVASPPSTSRSLLLHPLSAASHVSSHQPLNKDGGGGGVTSGTATSPSSASLPPSEGGWHQPAGMSCLLRILTHQLLETRTVLLALNEDCSSFPRYLRHLLHLTVSAPPRLLTQVVGHPKGVMVAASVTSLLSLLHSAPPLQRVKEVARREGGEMWGRGVEQLHLALRSSATAFLLSFIPPSIQSSIVTLCAVLSPHVLLPQLRSAVHTRAAFTIIPLCLFIVYRASRYRRVSHLRSLHSRLGLLLRLWHICFSLLGHANTTGGTALSHGNARGGGGGHDERRSSEWASEDDSFVLANREPARVPISRWLLELVPPELDASFWYHSSFRLSLVKFGLDVLYSSVQEWYRLFGCRAVGAPYLLLSILFFACQPHLAASTASRLMASPDIAVVRQAWRLLDTPMARRLVIKALPAISAAPNLAICREIELCDLDESDQHRRLPPAYRTSSGGTQSQGGGGRRVHGSGHRGKGGGGEGADEEDESRFEVVLSPSGGADRVLRVSASHDGRQSHRHLRRYQRTAAAASAVSNRLRESLSSLDEEGDFAVTPDPTVKLLLLSARPLRVTLNLRFHRVASHSHVRSLRPTSSPVILYFHGGGFFTDFRASHLHFLSQWATSLDVPIVYVDYSLAPDNAYPTALNECYDVYRWVVEGRLGLNAEHIVLVGDSTGGNLAAAVCMKAIIDAIRVPDAVVLACPILNLRLTPTPSRSLYMMDAVLPMNLLLQCRSLYLAGSASSNDADIDPCLSPIVASDHLLKQWPITSIMVGGYDPFVDDSVDFAHRLSANGVPVRLKVFEQLPHSFWDFAPLLPQAQLAVDLAAHWIQHTITEAQHNNREEEPSPQ